MDTALIDELQEDNRTTKLTVKRSLIKFFKKYRFQLSIFFGFLFFFNAFVVIPIACISIYRTIKNNYSARSRKIRYLLYSLMLLTNVALNIYSIIKFYEPIIESQSDYDVFEKEFIREGNGGFVTILNVSKEGKGKNIGFNKNAIGEIGDTIIVSVRVANKTSQPIENVKVELSPRNSSFNKLHKFFGTITGFNVDKIEESCYISTYHNTKLRSLDSVFIQTSNAKSRVKSMDKSMSYSLFNEGITVGELYPGPSNSVSISSLFVIEREKENIYKSGYNQDSAGPNLGFITIGYSGDTIRNIIEKDISIPMLSEDEDFHFNIYIDFKNQGVERILDAGTLLNITRRQNTILINSQLYSSNSIDLYDNVVLKNWKDEYRLYINKIDLQSKDEMRCKAIYNRTEISTDGLTTKGLEIGDIESGICGQGYFIIDTRVSYYKKKDSITD